jgi:hypothetical protein
MFQPGNAQCGVLNEQLWHAAVPRECLPARRRTGMGWVGEREGEKRGEHLSHLAKINYVQTKKQPVALARNLNGVKMAPPS